MIRPYSTNNQPSGVGENLLTAFKIQNGRLGPKKAQQVLERGSP